MSRFILPIQSAYDSNGKPLNGAKLYFYEVGTSTPKDTYSDEALTTANTNPVIADASGRFGNIYLNGEYDATLKTSADVTVWGAKKTSSISLFGDSILTFNTVADMVASKALNVGDIVETAGYTTVNDGGGAKYQIVAATTGTDDGGSFIDLDTHQAKAIFGPVVNIECFGANTSGDSTTEIGNAYAAHKTQGFILSSATDGEYIYNAIPDEKANYIGAGKIVRITGSAPWWAFESTDGENQKIKGMESIDKFRTLVAQSALTNVDDVTYLCVGDSTRASYDQIVFKTIRNELAYYNIETFLSAKSGQTADDWGNATGSGVKWTDLIGTNAYTYDAIPGTGSTTLLDVCLGINDCSNDTTVADITTIKSDIKAGIDGLIAARADLLVNLTEPNRLRNQPLKTSKLIQVMRELAYDNDWSLLRTVEKTVPTPSDAVDRAELYDDDTHPSEEGQRLIARALLDHLIPRDAKNNFAPNSPDRLTKGGGAYDQNVEDAFEFMHVALNDGWEQIQLWKFDADTYYFTNPAGSSSASKGFKPALNTETLFPADNGNNVIKIYDSSPPAGGGTWTRTRAFTFKLKDVSQLASIPNGTKIPLSAAVINPYPSRTFVPYADVKRSRPVLDIFFTGSPTASQVVARKRVTEKSTLYYNFMLSHGTAVATATGSTQFQIKVNGSQIGLVTFAAAAQEATMSTNPFATYTLYPGDLLEVVAPNPADATLADIGITLFATSAD